MRLFNVEQMVKFVQKVNCMSFDEFKKMYEAIFVVVSDGYVTEKFEVAQRNIGNWICSLDYNKLDKMLSYCLKE